MTDKNGTTTSGTTMWQDNHSGLRRHKLMTRALTDTIPPLYANDGADDPDAVVAKVKLFSPYNGWTLVHHGVGGRRPELCFGLVEGFETELGYFRSHGTLGSNRVRRRSRSGARPVLGAADPRRDQETVVGDSGLAVSCHRRNGQRRNNERRYHA